MEAAELESAGYGGKKMRIVVPQDTPHELSTRYALSWLLSSASWTQLFVSQRLCSQKRRLDSKPPALRRSLSLTSCLRARMLVVLVASVLRLRSWTNFEGSENICPNSPAGALAAFPQFSFAVRVIVPRGIEKSGHIHRQNLIRCHHSQTG